MFIIYLFWWLALLLCEPSHQLFFVYSFVTLTSFVCSFVTLMSLICFSFTRVSLCSSSLINPDLGPIYYFFLNWISYSLIHKTPIFKNRFSGTRRAIRAIYSSLCCSFQVNLSPISYPRLNSARFNIVLFLNWISYSLIHKTPFLLDFSYFWIGLGQIVPFSQICQDNSNYFSKLNLFLALSDVPRHFIFLLLYLL